LVEIKALITFDLSRKSLSEAFQDIVNKQIKEPNLNEINFEVPELEERETTIKMRTVSGINEADESITVTEPKEEEFRTSINSDK